ncbi:MAG TPA: hypothetical protein DDW31_09180 [candidate division Zixibacteria bacterium]|nr:hypothetical protein [candidate division Zixibacteria bacterium]
MPPVRGNVSMPRPLLAAALLAMAASSRGAVPELDRAVDQAVNEYYFARPKTFRSSGTVSIAVVPFASNDYFKGENVGAITAEIISRHLAGIKKLEVRQSLSEQAVSATDGPGQGGPSAQITVAGQVDRSDGAYHIAMRFLDSERREVAAREMTIPSGRFLGMLNRHLRWKHRTWAFQPYLQALYTERYLADGYPSRVVTSSRPGVSTSVSVDLSRMAIDETAEFTGGLRLTWRSRLMLDLAYTAHGHSSAEGQYLVAMTNLINPDYSSRMLAYVSTSAMSAALCGRAKLYGDLHGYAGAGWERTISVQTVSSMSRLWFSGSGGASEVRGYFLSPEGPLPSGGNVKDRASVPFLRAGIEWRPGRMGFNFLATYRLGTGGFRPLAMAVEEIYTPAGSEPQRSYYEVMDVSRYRLPRLSVGAAFALTL